MHISRILTVPDVIRDAYLKDRKTLDDEDIKYSRYTELWKQTLAVRRLHGIVPDVISRAFQAAEDPTWDPDLLRYVILWREVAARSVLDALGFTGECEKPKHDKIIAEAREWFTHPEQVEEIFDRAGVHAEPVIKAITETKPLTDFLKTGTENPTRKIIVVTKSKKKVGSPWPSVKSSRSQTPQKSPLVKNGNKRLKSFKTKPADFSRGTSKKSKIGSRSKRG